MKRFIAGLCGVVLFATAAQAQEIPDRKRGREDMIARQHRGEGLECKKRSSQERSDRKNTKPSYH